VQDWGEAPVPGTRDVTKGGQNRHKEWLQRIRDLATNRGWQVACWWRSDHSPAGFPDTCMVHVEQRRIAFIEAKTGTGRLTPHQRKWKNLLQAIGMEWYEMRPEDELKLIEMLERRPS